MLKTEQKNNVNMLKSLLAENIKHKEKNAKGKFYN